MKKTIFTLFLLLGALPAFAQNPTAVTGIITDSNSVPYFPATVTACLSPVTSNPIVNGVSVNPNIGTNYCVPTANTASTGFFSMSLFPNAAITPAATQWQFTVTTLGSAPPAGKGPQTFQVNITISGTSQNVGATLTAAAPTLLNSGGGGGAVSSVFTRTGAVVAVAGDYPLNLIGNPTAPASFVMGSNTVIFNTTTALAQFHAWKNTTAAVVGTSQGSPFLAVCGRAFHASADAEDCMTFSELPGNGNDAPITFAVGHTGTSTGQVDTTFPGPVKATGTTAGFVAMTQGSTSSAVEPCNAANTICKQAPTAVTSYLVTEPGVVGQGLVTNSVTGSADTQGFSGDANHSTTVTTGSGTSIGSTQLCSIANCPVGTYRVNVYIDITTACSTGGTYVVNLIYTDDQGSKTVVTNINGTGATPATGVLTLASTANFGEDTQILRSTGAASINYSTTAVACATGGPMVGKLYLSVEPVQ